MEEKNVSKENKVSESVAKQGVVQTPEGPMQETIFNHPAEMTQFIIGQMLESSDKVTPGKSKEDSWVEWTRLYEEGGIATKLSSFREPFRGFPPIEFVQGLDEIKKFCKKFFKDTIGIFKTTSKWKLLFLVLFFKDKIKKTIYATIDSIYESLKKFKLKPKMYSEPVREVYRVFEWLIDKEKQESVKIWLEKIKIIFCLLLEFDNAYRYRFQDIILEMNPLNFRANPIGEIGRLIAILSEREIGFTKKAEYEMLKKGITFYLKHNKKALSLIVSGMSESGLDLARLRLNYEDICFCEQRRDYIFGFMNHPGWFSGKQLEDFMKIIIPSLPEFKKMANDIEDIKKYLSPDQPKVEKVKV